MNLEQLENYQTHELQEIYEEVREELFNRRLMDINYIFPQRDENDEPQFFEVEEINTLQVVPISNSYYVGITGYHDEDLTLVFTLEQVKEISDYLATKPNWEKLN